MYQLTLKLMSPVQVKYHHSASGAAVNRTILGILQQQSSDAGDRVRAGIEVNLVNFQVSSALPCD
jgi:hypothetical protein